YEKLLEQGRMPDNFHFLRAEWLWSFPPLLFFLFFIVRNISYKSYWNNVCDASLLHYQLTQAQQQQPKKWQWLGAFSFLLLIFSIAIIALAGPSWEKKEQPVFQQDDALVVILDLSLSMNANDIKPSRLERAKHKLIDILKLKKEGQTALIAFSGDAHTVSPLTIDNKTIISLLPALTVSIMPLPGSH
ncbi:MAG: VWA domain-containing protein, partial [Thiotrichaceae bacterium]|nr:VWA domain-containing protein [Thiotrichaceae bacterium]